MADKNINISNGYNFSIMLLDELHLEEICADIKDQYENGIADLVLFKMTLVPEGNPPKNKVGELCRIYDRFRDRLSDMGLDCGVLVQASIGHGYPLNEMFPFQRYISRTDGTEQNKCCPYDPEFRQYFRGVMQEIATHKPKVIMVDDDFRLLFFSGKGCVCPMHMERFHALSGTDMSREELNAYIAAHGEDAEYSKLYIETQRDSLVGAAKEMRAGIDSVDPTIPGMYCTSGKACEFAADIAKALAGEGHPTVVRTHHGIYCPSGLREFTAPLIRLAEQIAILKKDVDIILGESDTCPHNRYAIGAQHFHSFYVGSILEGVTSAKRWITRLENFEPQAGIAYRKILKKYRGFYLTLQKLIAEVKPFGCCVPVFDKPYYALNSENWESENCRWGSSFLERVGLPLYFSEEHRDVLFLEGDIDTRYSDDQLRDLFAGNIVLASDTAARLIDRGFLDCIGVEVHPWNGKALTGEIMEFDHYICQTQKNAMELRPVYEGVRADSYVYHSSDGDITKERLFPGCTVFKNAYGGTTIVFSGTPVSTFYYTEGFSFLNETRKKQIIRLMEIMQPFPVYYPDDAELYMRAGSMSDGTLFVSVINLGFDTLEDLPLVVTEEIGAVEILQADGSLVQCDFTNEGEQIILNISVRTLDPVVVLLHPKNEVIQ